MRALIAALLIVLLPQAASAALQSRAEYLMGTVFKISLEHAGDAEALFAGAFEILRAHDKTLSDYDPDSELNRVQPLARRDWTPVSPLLCKALVASRYYGLLSEGAFDISVGPLVALWGFKDRNFRVPSDAAISEQLQATGLSQVGLSQVGGCRLRLWHPRTGLDFGAIGKGLALDAAGAWLRAQGVRAAALDAGGSSMLFLAAPSVSPRGWPVLLRHQDQPALWLSHRALASSDDDQQFFERQGVRYGHLLDPRTGRPVAAGGITVLGSSATATDALSTALSVLPRARGTALARLLGAELLSRP